MQKIIEFPSGLKLVTVHNPAVRSVAAGVFVDAGAVYETPDQSGISHFIEHMVFKGTLKRSSFDIVNEIDSIGAQINAFTTKSYTCFYTVSLDSNVEKCLEVLSDLYFNPRFDEEELERERKVVIEEINESEDTPDDLCLERLSSAFFKGHPLEKPILGTKKTLKAMNGQALREYKNQRYTPNNTVIALVGNITERFAESLARKYFEDLTQNQANWERRPLSHAVPCSVSVSKKKDIEQAHIAFSFPCVPYDDEKSVAVQLLANVFGMEMSSRLFQSVRERLGLCYTIMGYPSAYENNGCFVIFTSTNPESVELAVKAIRNEIDLLLRSGISEDELKKGKEQLKTSLVLGQESTSAVMRAYGRHVLQTGKIYDIDNRISRIDALTRDDITEAAKLIFDFDSVASSFVGRGTQHDLLGLLKNN